MLIAKYTSKTQGLRPTFNSDYTYTVDREELVNDIYEVELSADTDFSTVSFNGKADLLTVDYLKVTSKVTLIESMFYACTSLTSVNTSDWVTSNVTKMAYTFANCSALTSLDVSNFDTSQVTTMHSLFRNCNKLTLLNTSNFDTRNVISMVHMFSGCSKLTQLDVSNFVTSNVLEMNNMFYNCLGVTLLDVSKWDTSNVGNMQYMFSGCSKLQHIGMLYCDSNTVNAIANALPTVSGLTRTIYIQDTKSDIYTPSDSIIFYDYTDSRTIITLPQQLNSGDILTWNDSLRRYILKKADSRVTEIDTDVKYILDVVGPYYRIETDEKESAPASMTVKLYISKDVL